MLGKAYIEKKKNQTKLTPMELEEKYRAINEAKYLKREEKKAKYKDVNENLPVVEIRIPNYWLDEPSNGPIRNKYIDLELPKYKDWLDRLEWLWRVSKAMHANKYPSDIYMGPVKRKIIRT